MWAIRNAFAPVGIILLVVLTAVWDGFILYEFFRLVELAF
jgi:hypothetical protein